MPIFPHDYTHTAGRWEMFKARIFGRKIETKDMTIYQWRGKFYITRCGTLL